METLKTAIEFVSTGGSGQEGGASAASTGDPLLIVCAIAVILCIGGFLFAFMQRKKAYIGVTGSHIKSPQFNQNRFNMITVILSAIIAFSVCGIICSFTTHNAIADNNASDMVSNKITATVDNNTGSVSIEDAYIQNSTDNRILFKTVKIAKTEADGDCTYTLKLDGNEIFKDKADVEKTFDDPIVTTNKQTLHLDTDMSPDIAKSFIGKTPLSIEYVFDKDKEASPQKKADAEAEITKDAVDTKTEIDGLNLTPEQKEALKKSIDEVLDATKTAITNAKWESEVDQAKKDGEKQIQGILNNAKAQSLVNTKTETKEQVDSETQQAYDAIKEIANLSENEKGIFNSEIKEIKSATDSNINNAKTEEEVKQHLQVFENNIEEITTKAEEKALANLESAKESANEQIEESSTTTKDQIDLLNLDDEEKLEYNNQINKEAEDTKEAIESRSLITEVEKDKADFKKTIDDIFAAAKAQALIHTKDETKEVVDEESSSGQEYINNMDNLYKDDKNGFTERIETASYICKDEIDNAETETAVSAAHTKFQETLTTIEEEAASKASLNLSNKKAAATYDVVGKTNTAKNNVDLLTLPGSVKNTAKADIAKLSSDSQDNINDASTMSEVDELFYSFKADLQSLVDEYTELQKSYHKVDVGASKLVYGSFSTDAEDDLGKEDATITIVYTPEEGKVYTIDEVKVTTAEGEITVKVTGRYASFTMPKGDVTVIVKEIQGYTVTVNNDGHGDASADIDIAKKEATVQLTANPHQGYEFDKWESSDVEISSDNTFVMPEKNVSITAVFKAEAQKRFLAVYDSNATLTFFYDNQPHLSDSSTHVFWDLPTNAQVDGDWPYHANRNNIKKVVIDESMKEFKGLESTAYMCADMKNAEDIEGFENLDTSNVKNMSYMFNKYGKSEINYLDLSSFTVNSSINIVSLLDGMTVKSFSLGPNWKDKTMQDAGLREIDWYKLPDGTEALKPAQIPGGVLTEKTTYSDTKPAPPVTPDYCAINIVDEDATAENPATLTIFKDDNDNLLNLNYKINNGEWIPFSSETEWEVPNLTYNDVVYLKGNNFEDTGASHKGFSTEEYTNSIAVDKKFIVTGEATSLIYGDDTSERTKNIPGSYCFYSLFDNDMTSKLTSENLLSVSANFLPFTKLTEHCFEYMFYSCESMNPEENFNLPATSIETRSYYSMFEHCKSLTNVPEELPALELKDSCYYGMFSDCESLVKAPKLPAGVEEGCLAKECYRQMFYLCTSLETTPDLLAPIDQMDKDTILGCYGGMFYKCEKIESIKVGFQRFPFDPVGSYQYYCTADWMTEGPADNFIFIGPEDAHYDDADYNNCDAIPSKNSSPSNCVTITVKDISATDANPAKFTINNTNGNKPNLSYRVNKQGEFKGIDMSQEVITLDCNLKNNDVLELKGSNINGFNGNDKYTTFSLNRLFIVSGNVMGLIDADNPPSAIPSEGCFNRLFASSEDSVNKSNLSYISQNFLPAITLKANCYKEMFAYSPYLLTLKNGILPATELSESCYHNMFEHCERLSLTNDFSLPAGVPDEQGHIVGHLAKSCYRGMFASCAGKDEEGHPLGIRTVSKNLLKATNMAEDCYAYMFQYCTNLRISVTDILPAGKENGSLANTCYEGMFFGCTSIFEAPTLPASYDLMNSATDCYKQMFNGCSKLESIKVGFDKFPKNNDVYKCTENWLNGVSENGKFNGPEDNQYTDDDYNKVSAIPWAKPSPKDSYFTITIGQIPEGQPAHFIVKNSEGHQANLLISYNEGKTWYEIPYAPTWQSPDLFSGQKILLKGYNQQGLNLIPDEAEPQSWQYTNFDCDCTYSVSGNIMSLLFGENFVDPRVSIDGSPGCFGTLFKNSVNLTNINNLVLPAGSRDQQGQPMSRINTRCYMQMFYNTGIKQIPANLLPAIELFESCYKEMFAHCTKLESIDKLILPAGTPDQQGQPQGRLRNFCYESMFEGCESQELTKAPNLLAIDEALVQQEGEYKQMFRFCTYLNEITVGFHQFPKNADQYMSTENWLQGVANSGTFHGPEGIVYDESDYNNPSAIPWPKPAPPVTPDYCAINIVDEEASADNPATLTIVKDKNDNLLNLNYKINNGEWIAFSTDNNWKVTGLKNNDVVYLKGNNYENTETTHAGFSYIDKDEDINYMNRIEVDKKFSLSGEATTLVYGDIIDESKVKTVPREYCFYGLFGTCSKLISINSKFLPFTDLAKDCYILMFVACTSLASVPQNLLPATTLTESCYRTMFSLCNGLTSLPENFLPAEKLANECYSQMFFGCSGLESIPNNLLPAEKLANECYSQMFSGCSGLESIPENLLPAEELNEYCYSAMFEGCKSLTSLPSGLLPAKTLASPCYSSMFKNCIGLTSLPENLLPAEELNEYCYSAMFEGCKSLTSLPSGLLPAKKLGKYCYENMFYKCTGLTSLPENLLMASNLHEGCYDHMFAECSNLKLSNESGDYIAFECPDYGSTVSPAYCMFKEVPGVKETPTPGDKYYCGNPTPVEKTVKTVYNAEGGANTLTFYYDDEDHSGEGTVETDIPTNATSAAEWPYNGYRLSIKKVIIDESMQEYDGFESTAFMCVHMINANDIAGFDNLDVSKVTNMTYMFGNYGSGSPAVDTKINSVPDVSGWKTSRVENMTYMFFNYGSYSSTLNHAPKCAHVDGTDTWNLSSITQMTSMFCNYGAFAKNLNVVPDVSGWDFSSNDSGVELTNLFSSYAMGNDNIATKISTVPNVNSWKTDKVTNMVNMFNSYGYYSSENLESLDLSSFTVTSSTNVSQMFKFMPLHSFSLGPGWFGRTMKDAGLENKKWYKSYGTELTPADIPGDTRLTEKTTYTDTKPAPPVEWTPMTATSGDAEHSVINFYPAFNDAKEIEGYEFGVYNNGEVVRIAPATMQDIYNELESLEDKTLYYKKTDASAQALKCYTVINKPWNKVFSKSTEEKGKADGYYTDFINNYVVFEIYR